MLSEVRSAALGAKHSGWGAEHFSKNSLMAKCFGLNRLEKILLGKLLLG